MNKIELTEETIQTLRFCFHHRFNSINTFILLYITNGGFYRNKEEILELCDLLTKVVNVEKDQAVIKEIEVDGLIIEQEEYIPPTLDSFAEKTGLFRNEKEIIQLLLDFNENSYIRIFDFIKNKLLYEYSEK